MLKRVFSEHPASVGESYFEHMGVAFRFSGKMFSAAFCCFVHGLFPFLFVRAGSDCVSELYLAMVIKRDRRKGVSVPTAAISDQQSAGVHPAE